MITKIAYKEPAIVPLNSLSTHGANCVSNGSSATQFCQDGSSAGTDCGSGTSAQWTCGPTGNSVVGVCNSNGMFAASSCVTIGSTGA